MPAIDFLRIIDILGTAAFAISGSSMAIRKGLDVFGILVIAFVTSVGGGTLRDVLMGHLPVAWLTNELTIGVILLASITTMLFHRRIIRLSTSLFLFDSLGLGLFTIIGLQQGLQAGFSPGIAITLGTITACFGGVIRDVLLNEVPLIFRKEIYASACIAGGLVYFLLVQMRISVPVAQLYCMATIFIIRLVAVRYRLRMPQIGR